MAAQLGTLKNLRVKVDGTLVNASVVGQTIKVPLGASLSAGESTDVWVAFKARLGTSGASRDYFFAKLNGVAQMYRFIPWLSRRIPFGSGGHGEPFVTPVSPRVEVTVSADRKLDWATSGRRIRKVDARTFVYVAKNVRDFNIAASPDWKTARGTSKDGQTVILAHTSTADARRWVRLAREELARYKSKTGVAYPACHVQPRRDRQRAGHGVAGAHLDPRLAGLVRTSLSRLARDRPPVVVLHGGQRPVHGRLRRRGPGRVLLAQGSPLDPFEPLQDGPPRPRDPLLLGACYYEVIYIQGSRFLNNLRKDFGGGKFKAAIKAYTKDNRFEIGSNRRLLEALRAKMGDGVLKRYRNRFPSLY